MHDKALWGTALNAGLRRGGMLGLMWEDVDIAGAQIHVQRSWDVSEGYDVGPKSADGRRKVPIASALKALFAAHRLASRTEGHVFGTTGTGVAAIRRVTKRADDAWEAVNEKGRRQREGAQHLHGSREHQHHARPLRPSDAGSEAEAATVLDAYLDCASRSGPQR